MEVQNSTAYIDQQQSIASPNRVPGCVGFTVGAIGLAATGAIGTHILDDMLKQKVLQDPALNNIFCLCIMSGILVGGLAFSLGAAATSKKVTEFVISKFS